MPGHFMDMIAEKHKGQTVLAVTHLGVIKACIAAVFGCSIQRSMNYIAFNTSLTVIDFLRKASHSDGLQRYAPP